MTTTSVDLVDQHRATIDQSTINRSNRHTMNLDEFLGHKNAERGSGSKILNWKKNTPPLIDTWLHTRAPIVALWRHGWPRVAEIERDGEKVKEVWGGNFNCWEPEETLRRQHRRADDGTRLSPPRICPMCLLIEHVRDEVRAGRIDWLTPIFEFEGDDPKQTIVLSAAGIYNGFNGELSRQDIADMRKAGVRRDEAWKQNSVAKCSYVFSILNHATPEKGVQVAIETTALGDAVKRVIRDQIDSLGETDGNPLRNPYAIRWEYRPNEQKFDQKYRALAMPKLALTPEIEELITSNPPDVSQLIERGNIGALRASMEAHAKIQLPWDRLFAAAEAESGLSRPMVNVPERVESKQSPAPAQTRRAQKPAEKTQPDYPPGTVLIPCDACNADMAETDDTCWKCGAKYELDDAPAATVKPSPAKTPATPKTNAKWPGEEAEDDLGW